MVVDPYKEYVNKARQAKEASRADSLSKLNGDESGVSGISASYPNEGGVLQRDIFAKTKNAMEERSLKQRPDYGLSGEQAQLQRTVSSNTFRPSSGIPKSEGRSSDVPGLMAGVATAAANNVNRFDPSKLTLGNNEFTGQVGMFKDGKMLDTAQSQNALGIDKKPGVFIGKIDTSKMGGTIDFTQMFDQDAKIAQARLNNAGQDYVFGNQNPQFFTGPGEPGPGTYGREMNDMRSRRDLLLSQVDSFNRSNPVRPNMNLGESIDRALATKGMRDEIRQIDAQIFGRTELANKIMTALIGNQGDLAKQGMANQGALDQQAMENSGTFATRQMMEAAETERNDANIAAGRFDPKTQKTDETLKSQNKFTSDAYLQYLKSALENGSMTREQYLTEVKAFTNRIGAQPDLTSGI